MSPKKQKKFSTQSAGRPNSEINVTPLVDVVLVLLIIFMVVTPLLEKDIEVKVPETEKLEDNTPPPQDQLIVSINEKGELKINTEPISDADYQQKLSRQLAAKKAGDKLVFFMPDEKTNYGKLIMALDGAKGAGAETLGMMTELPEGLQPAGAAPPPGAPSAPAVPGGSASPASP